MNRIIFAATALAGLALIANQKPLREVSRASSAAMFITKEAPYRVPEKSESAPRERPVAVEVTDEALEELRRSAKYARVLIPV